MTARAISGVQAGEHFCCIYADEQQPAGVFARFLAGGLTQGRKALLIDLDPSSSLFSAALASIGRDVAGRSRLSFRDAREMFGATEAFDPRAALERIHAEIDAAFAEGFTGLQIAGAMDWAAALPAGALVRFEALLDAPGALPGASMLCLYDRRHFDPALLLDALLAHTHAEGGWPAATGRAAADYTPQADIQTALRESENRYKAIFDASADMILIHDMAGRILEVNPAACERLGYAPHELLGRPSDAIDAPELAGQFQVRMALVEKFGALSFETVHMTRSGDMVPVEVNASLIQFGGRPAVINTARDITGRKQDELTLVNVNQALASANEALEVSNAALSESEQKFRSLVQSSPSGIALADETGRLVEFNAACETIFGVPAGEVFGSTIAGFSFKVLPSERRTDAERLRLELEMELALSGVGSWLGRVREQEICRPNGQRVTIQTTGFPIRTERGYMVGMITRDVTRQRAAELELESYRQRLETMVADRTAQLQTEISAKQQYEQKLEASLAEKEIMLREIHHRVKNNLNVIIALINLQKGSQSDPQVLEVFKDLQTRAYTMALVHESLYRSPSLSRVDFPKYLETLVSYLSTAYSPDARLGSVNLQVDADAVSLNIETAIPCGLIVNELVTNALKYAYPAGAHTSEREARVLVRLERIGGDEDAAVPDSRAVRRYLLTVQDNGVGMPPGLDWQSAATLGLQLVQVLSHQLGGTLTLDSSQGTTWRLEFPERK